MSELGNGLTRIFLAGVGALAVTAEKSKEVVDELVKKGELTVEQGKILNEELKRDAAAKVKEAVASIQTPESVEKIISRVDRMTPEERAALKKKLEEAEQKPADAQSEESAVCSADENESEQA
jgi:polyhydroxyalkanoate synthesis regulator phasin